MADSSRCRPIQRPRRGRGGRTLQTGRARPCGTFRRAGWPRDGRGRLRRPCRGGGSRARRSFSLPLSLSLSLCLSAPHWLALQSSPTSRRSACSHVDASTYRALSRLRSPSHGATTVSASAAGKKCGGPSGGWRGGGVGGCVRNPRADAMEVVRLPAGLAPVFAPPILGVASQRHDVGQALAPAGKDAEDKHQRLAPVGEQPPAGRRGFLAIEADRAVQEVHVHEVKKPRQCSASRDSLRERAPLHPAIRDRFRRRQRGGRPRQVLARQRLARNHLPPLSFRA